MRKDPEATKAYMKVYRQGAKYKESRYAYRETAREKTYLVLSKTKLRAAEKGLPFNLVTDDIVIPTICPVLGIPLLRNRGYGPADGSPSIDRIVPTKGYVRGNINIISNRANRIKSDVTDPNELAAVAEYVASQYSLQQLCDMAVL